MGGVQNSSGNSGGVGGLFYWSKKMEIPGRGGGGLREIPSVVGVWIFSGTTQLEKVSVSRTIRLRELFPYEKRGIENKFRKCSCLLKRVSISG